MRQYETIHEAIEDEYEIHIVLTHQVDTDDAWEGVAFHMVKCLVSNQVFYSGDDIRAAFTHMRNNRMVSGLILEQIELLTCGTDWGYDRHDQCIIER